ncbi:hypothetical protein AAFF_G00000710 [Aldrovandia affinis]|uniref:Uncharacterized protein n=1 Tax=Aldrovandia affinis TaxID=143900 RepID=A0AAD7X2Y7_9TELE|nr:hypothetical protein AAFF_G00000710 [Aldrovandia affinis]
MTRNQCVNHTLRTVEVFGRAAWARQGIQHVLRSLRSVCIGRGSYPYAVRLPDTPLGSASSPQSPSSRVRRRMGRDLAAPAQYRSHPVSPDQCLPATLSHAGRTLQSHSKKCSTE